MKKVLVANRGEIAIRIFRALAELGLDTVGVYAYEDAGSVHRFKADEAYLIGEGKKPVEAYLDIEDIIRVAKKSGADAIHPGYGFLAENIQFATRCQEEGIKFIGPKLDTLHMFGDKINAKQAAIDHNVPIVPSSNGAISSVDEVYDFAKEHGYPLIIKAVLGGGGRGMRIVNSEDEIQASYSGAISEATKAFGSGEVYVEKYIENPRHIEIQILGDEHGNVVHLWERDCSVQRRHQKVIEMAPAVGLTDAKREEICNVARQFMDEVNYVNAGTVEFLYSEDGSFYFIEVNPRIQVEHTITELITNVDIVQSQILIAQGKDLHTDLHLPKDKAIETIGYAIQSRITTEDPENDFLPDTGRINTYRSPGGMGVRLDAGNGFQGTVVTPYFDSLIAKLCTYGPTFEQALIKMDRSLREFRIRGVKTNIPFLLNVVNNEVFREGKATTSFIGETPSLFNFPKSKNRGNKILSYLADTTVNGYPGVGKLSKGNLYLVEAPKELNTLAEPIRPKHILENQGADAVSDWIKSQSELLITDTTFRDAHQSLLATRVRTKDLVEIAKVMEQAIPNLFSMEVWGGATFDTSYRFLNESPWDRLRKLRKAMPNTLLQMLFRGSNAVGYSAYPDNVLKAFIDHAAETGIDVFRVFDSLNWLPQMTKSIEYVRDAGKIAEGTICYTADLFDESRPTYSLDYYVNLAIELEKSGAHTLAIKDMAGLLKPDATYALVAELKDRLSIPVHLHTHDTAGMGVSNVIAATKAGVDIFDVAMDPMAGGTSQPAIGSVYYALSDQQRQPKLDIENVEQVNQYWRGVRGYYHAFDNKSSAPLSSIYQHEMPGGQYTNLQQQAKGVGLEARWDDVQKMYHDVNMLFGDIVKVTPSSKVVGDMALFMVQNNIDNDNFFDKAETIDFPESVIEFFEGKLGQPAGGFPKDVQEAILKGRPASTERPGDLVAPADFEAIKEELNEKVTRDVTDEDVLSYIMYPQVFVDYCKATDRYGDVSSIDTLSFFYGMEPEEIIEVEIEQGKRFYIKLLQIGELGPEGKRVVSFEFNGQARQITVADVHADVHEVSRDKADHSNHNHVGATMPGSVVKVLVEVGDKVEAGQALLITEAMKMETTIQSPKAGEVKSVLVHEGESIETSDLLIELLP